jgi:site-specific recombinase XerD
MIELWRNVRAHLPTLEDTVVYTARHTCASWQVQRGIDLMRVKEWMGHTSFQTTLGYSHLSPKHLMDNLSVLEGGAAPKLMVISGGSV